MSSEEDYAEIKKELGDVLWYLAMLADAFDFYLENAGPAVAGRFLGEFERVAKLLVDNPGFGTPLAGGRRMFPLRVFPYSVIYPIF